MGICFAVAAASVFLERCRRQSRLKVWRLAARRVWRLLSASSTARGRRPDRRVSSPRRAVQRRRRPLVAGRLWACHLGRSLRCGRSCASWISWPWLWCGLCLRGEVRREMWAGGRSCRDGQYGCRAEVESGVMSETYSGASPALRLCLCGIVGAVLCLCKSGFCNWQTRHCRKMFHWLQGSCVRRLKLCFSGWPPLAARELLIHWTDLLHQSTPQSLFGLASQWGLVQIVACILRCTPYEGAGIW